MANGRAAVPTPRPSSNSEWFTGALVVGLNLVAGIFIWSIWKGTGVSGLGPAAVFGLMVGTVLLVVGAVRAVLDARAAHRDPHGRRDRRPSRNVRRFEHAPIASPRVAAPTIAEVPRSARLFQPPERESTTIEPGADVQAEFERVVNEPAVDEEAEMEPATVELAAIGPTAVEPLMTEPDAQPVHPSTFGEPARATIEPAAARLPLAGLHGLGATMQARMFDHGLVTQDDLAAIGDDELEDLAADLGTFPGRLAGWIAEARANLAAADPYMRSA